METAISMAGNVGTEVDYTSGEGYSFASFRLAATPRIRRGGEWTDGETVWTTVQAVNRTAENVRASVHKGEAVVVVGRLRARRWVGQDGQQHERLVLEAKSVGHDLARGTSRFTRNERMAPAEPRADSGPALESRPDGERCGADDEAESLPAESLASVEDGVAEPAA